LLSTKKSILSGANLDPVVKVSPAVKSKIAIINASPPMLAKAGHQKQEPLIIERVKLVIAF